MGIVRRTATAVFVLFALFLLAVVAGARFWTDWLWFAHLGLAGVFWRRLAWRWGIRLAVAALFSLVLYCNLFVARRMLRRAMEAVPHVAEKQHPIETVNSRWITRGMAAASVVFGFLSSAGLASLWQDALLYLKGTSYGAVDPIFGRDISYYFFDLPFFQELYQALQGLVVVNISVVLIFYLATRTIRFPNGRPYADRGVKAHLTVLLASVLGLKAWSFILDMYMLVYSTRGITYGASYTDVHAYALALRVLAGLGAIAALALLINIFRSGLRLTVAALVMMAVLSLLLGEVYPAFVQRFVVEPNELAKETPYIKHNIEMTREAYGLDAIKEYYYEAGQELTYSDVANSVALDNIRLWDWRPLLQVYSQLQEMRLYYEFREVDLDRYWLDGRYRQVMIAARELNPSQIQNKTWINEKLQYTHGYGVVVSPVNEVTAEGLPRFLVSDVPPRTQIAELAVSRPEIYYGELTNNYVIVNTKTPEFDYPRGDDNAQTYYEGIGGVELSNVLVRLLFAVRMRDPKILLSREITSRSRIMFYRNILERAKRVAPFLKYDQDPYLVIADGRLFWLLDAYTTTSFFPYSTPTRGWGNYVRNAVKVVIDAYNGTIRFYISDPSDPIVRTYDRMFPGLLMSLEAMPDELRSHLRYPEDLFALQASVYAAYHMDSPTVFYNREDLWSIPQEIVGSSSLAMTPYYVTLQMPDSNRPEFVLMLPFTPARKDNMVAWLVARNDAPNYGELIVYKFPKHELTYGPMQIEARIDQDSEISQLITLWSRSGSSVYRGNQLVIPIQNGLLYVEPVYLQAEQSQMPELKRIVVATGARLAMGSTLDEALRSLFRVEQDESRSERQRTPQSELSDGSVAQLIKQAVKEYEMAKGRLQQGDWAGYGESMEQLEKVLQDLNSLVSPAEADDVGADTVL